MAARGTVGTGCLPVAKFAVSENRNGWPTSANDAAFVSLIRGEDREDRGLKYLTGVPLCRLGSWGVLW